MTTSADCNGVMIRLDGDCAPFAPTLTCKPGEEDGVFTVTLAVTARKPALLPDLKLTWELPSVDFHHKWNPRCGQNRALDIGPGSFNHIESSAQSGCPVFSLYSLDGTNACTWALSDVIHDIRTGGEYRSGKCFYCRTEVTGTAVGVVDHYAIDIRFDFRRIPYYRVLADVARYWESLPGCRPCAIPAAARKPLFSSWYIYEVRIDPDDLEQNCALAKAIGFDTVILDDGWQTSQVTTGYQNNGDWEVCEEKIPDLAGHVKRVQAMGMKYMVWFSVPYIGIESKAYTRFRDMLLPGREGSPQFCIDLRFPEARRYLIETYETFVNRYGVDGLKLDFICTCLDRNPAADLLADGRRDCVSMGEAMCRLLDETMTRLRRINPEILIEFRQAYTGPAMRPFGNMFRAVDCANSLGDNRIRTLDLRLLAGNTAVHADPITWHDDDPDHSAAMQIIHTLFAVPQISRKISELKASHRRMLRQQLAFIREHEDVLQCGELRPLYPHFLYPVVVARTERKMVVAFYAEMPVRLGNETLPPELYLVNGSYAKEVLVELGTAPGSVEVTVTDCCGETIRRDSMTLSAGFHRFAVPPAAHLRMCRKA